MIILFLYIVFSYLFMIGFYAKSQLERAREFGAMMALALAPIGFPVSLGIYFVSKWRNE